MSQYVKIILIIVVILVFLGITTVNSDYVSI